MASSTTEALTITKHDLYRLKKDIIANANENIWNGEIVATASTHGFWEPDKDFKIKVKVNELKRKFHQDRYLQIKYLPRDVAEAEIRKMLSDFPISSVILSCGNGSAGSAAAYLEDPEMLEDWDRERQFLLRGQRIPVNPSPSEFILCVARFPLNYSELSFTGLVSSYGEVKMCFLMISEKTGESKGYGFVAYSCKEAAVHARNKLDGMFINDLKLCADFIQSTHTTLESLHSKCLFVDNLPHNFRDMGEFRSIFSKIVNPPYCQIALKYGVPQDWGLVEYSTGEDAENALARLNGYELHEKRLRISYHIPGIRAINLYLKLLNDPDIGRERNAGLLPDPPAPAVYQTFKNLQKQNPIFAQSLQSIMFSELLGGNAGEVQGNSSGSEDNCKHPHTYPNKTIKIPPPPQASASQACPKESTVVAGKNDQSALLTVLASQLQAEFTAAGYNPAFLHSQQMVSLLKNCVKGSINGTSPMVSTVPPSMMQPIIATHGSPYGAPVQAIPPISTIPGFNSPVSFEEFLNSQKVQIMNPALLQKVQHLVDLQADGSQIPQTFPGPYPNNQNICSSLFIKQSMNSDGNVPTTSPSSNSEHSNGFEKNGGPKKLEGVTTDSIKLSDILNEAQISLHSLLGNMVNGHHNPTIHIHQNILTTSTHIDKQQLNNNTTNIDQHTSRNEQVNHLHNKANSDHSNSPSPVESCGSTPPRRVASEIRRPSSVPNAPKPGTLPTPIWSINVPPPHITNRPPPRIASNKSPPYPLRNGPLHQQRASPKPIGFEYKWNTGPLVPSFPPPSIQGGWRPMGFNCPPPLSNITPIGQKRKYPKILPSPEPSPEGNYIGQHSQGIGGHYADSYFKRKKKN